MNIDLRTEAGTVSLVVTPAQQPYQAEYAVRMLQYNRIPGLLPMQPRSMNGQQQFWYDITGLQPFAAGCKAAGLTEDQVSLLLSGLLATLEELGSYLLDPAWLLLSPEYLYLSPSKPGILLCCVPDRTPSPDEPAALAEWMLRRLNHHDRPAVLAVYRFYQKVTEPNVSLQAALWDVLNVSPPPEWTPLSSPLPSANAQQAEAVPAPALPDTPGRPSAGRNKLLFFLIAATGAVAADLSALFCGILTLRQAGGICFLAGCAVFLVFRHTGKEGAWK